MKSKKLLKIVTSILFAFYIAIPLAVGLMRGQPADGGSAGTVTPAGSACMRARARHTLSFVRRGGAICEIGPGRGVLAQQAWETGFVYWAVDMDRAILEAVKAERKYLARVPPLPELPYSPDAVVIESVLEHLNNSNEVVEILSEVHDRLADDGILVVRVPDIRYAQWRFWDSAPDHAYVTSRRRMAMLFRQAGFGIVAEGYYLDQFTGPAAQLIYHGKKLWPWSRLHELFYAPWQESAFSKLAEKVPAYYIVGVKP